MRVPACSHTPPADDPSLSSFSARRIESLRFDILVTVWRVSKHSLRDCACACRPNVLVEELVKQEHNIISFYVRCWMNGGIMASQALPLAVLRRTSCVKLHLVPSYSTTLGPKGHQVSICEPCSPPRQEKPSLIQGGADSIRAGWEPTRYLHLLPYPTQDSRLAGR